MPVRPIDLACAHAIAGIVIGGWAGAGRRPRPPRTAHQLAYIGACAGTAWSATARDQRSRPGVALALAGLVALPRTRPGSRVHAAVAGTAAAALWWARRRTPHRAGVSAMLDRGSSWR